MKYSLFVMSANTNANKLEMEMVDEFENLIKPESTVNGK